MLLDTIVATSDVLNTTVSIEIEEVHIFCCSKNVASCAKL